MTKCYDATPPYIKADDDKVLCDGYVATGLGGKVYNVNTAALENWQEMTRAEADALIEANTPPEDTEDTEVAAEIKEKAAAYDIIMGVNSNE